MRKICNRCNKLKNIDKFYYRKELNKFRNMCIECHKEKTQFLKYEIYPWRKHFYAARRRCENKKDSHYYCYGDRGIKFLLTKEELKKLWFRDKAYEMKKPSIDRIDNDGHYEYSNCRFIEMSENRPIPNPKKRKVKQYNLEGNFIKEWNSVKEASTVLNIPAPNISLCINNHRKTAGKYIWK